MRQIKIGNTTETVVERSDYPPERIRSILGKETVAVTMPLQDNNGEPMAAVRVVLKTFPGETEQSALNRARPIVKEMQASAQSLAELTQ